LAEVN